MRLGVTDDDDVGLKGVEDRFLVGLTGADHSKLTVSLQVCAQRLEALSLQQGRDFGLGLEPSFVVNHLCDRFTAAGVVHVSGQLGVCDHLHANHVGVPAYRERSRMLRTPLPGRTCIEKHGDGLGIKSFHRSSRWRATPGAGHVVFRIARHLSSSTRARMS